jgi:hypothetical protein
MSAPQAPGVDHICPIPRDPQKERFANWLARSQPVMISVSIGVRTSPGVYGYGLRLHLVNDDICLVV